MSDFKIQPDDAAFRDKTPNRRIRRSSMGSADHRSYNSASSAGDFETARNKSTGKRRSLSQGRVNINRAQQSKNETTAAQDLNLQPKTILKLLHKITRSSSSSLAGCTLRDLVEQQNPPSRRNLLTQFDAVPTAACSFAQSTPKPANDGSLGHFFDFSRELSTVQKETGDQSSMAYRQHLLTKFEETTDRMCKKYAKMTASEHNKRRSELLGPDLIQNVTEKLAEFNQTIRLLTCCPVGREIRTILQEKAPPVGIPCPAKSHQELVSAIERLDAIVAQFKNFPDEAALKNALVQDYKELDHCLQKLETLSDDYYRLVEATQKLLPDQKTDVV